MSGYIIGRQYKISLLALAKIASAGIKVIGGGDVVTCHAVDSSGCLASNDVTVGGVVAPVTTPIETPSGLICGWPVAPRAALFAGLLTLIEEV